MADSSFLLGLLQGSAQGVVNNQLALREQQMQKERAQLAIAGNLIQSGNFETFLALDPKIRKSAGVSPELEGALSSLVGLQREERTLRMRGLLAGTRASESQAQAAEMGLEQERKRQNIISQRPPEEQEELRVPEITQRKAALATARGQQLVAEKAELDIATTKRINEAYEGLSTADKFAVNFPEAARTKAQLSIAGMQVAAQKEIARLGRQSQEAIANLGLKKEEERQATQLDTQKRGLQTQLVNLAGKTKNKTKAGKYTFYQFDTEEEANAYVEQVNNIIGQYNAIDARQSAITKQPPDQATPWGVIKKPAEGGILGLGKYFGQDKYIVGPPVPQAEPGAAETPKSEFEMRLQKLLGELSATNAPPAGSTGTAEVPVAGAAAGAEPTAAPAARINSKQMNSATVHFQNLYKDTAQQDDALERYIALRNQGLTHSAAMNTAARSRKAE